MTQSSTGPTTLDANIKERGEHRTQHTLLINFYTVLTSHSYISITTSANMLAYKTTILGLIALFGLPALGEANCRSVSYTEMLETRDSSDSTLGPRGIYARTLDGRCIFVDAAADGEFAKRHSDIHAGLMDYVKRSPVEGLEFLGDAVANPLEKRALACGAVCGGPTKCGCGSCKYDSQYCYAGGCTTTYRCQK